MLEKWLTFWQVTGLICAILAAVSAFGISHINKKIKERDKSTISPINQYKDFDNVILDAKVDSVEEDGILVEHSGRTIIDGAKVSKAKGAGIKITDKKEDKKSK